MKISLPALLIKISKRLYFSKNVFAKDRTELKSFKSKSSIKTFWLFVSWVILSSACFARCLSLHANMTVAPILFLHKSY